MILEAARAIPVKNLSEQACRIATPVRSRNRETI